VDFMVMLHARTILLIDDDPSERETLRRVLEMYGATVLVASDGWEGLDRLHERRVDAVLCDLTMPGMDGLEFARRLRQRPRDQRTLLIAVTGHGGPTDFMATWAAGFDGHVVKPVSRDILDALAHRIAQHAGRVDRGAC
jgi:two-component system CheB/CheR fusion protein